MGASDNQLDNIFEKLNKDNSKDGKKKGIKTFRASDIRIGSHIPYGVSSRIAELDLAVGKPGYPVGRIVELFGLPRCGKTTAALLAIAEVQKMGGNALFIDTEFTFDKDRASEMGVDVETLRIADADTIEDIFSNIRELLALMTDYNKPFVIVVDSITAVPTKWGKENDLDSDRPGDQAKAIKRGMRIITPLIAKKNVLLLMVNHAYETMSAWGKKSKASGGHGIKFGASIRINFSHVKELREEKSGNKSRMRLGQGVKIEVEKVKIAHLKFPSFEIDLLNEGGFNSCNSLLEALLSIGVITQKNPYSSCEWGEITFPKKDWMQVLSQNGGKEAVYKFFVEEACKRGFMKAYGEVKESE